MSPNKDLEDQFNVLFDEEEVEEQADAVEEVAAEVKFAEAEQKFTETEPKFVAAEPEFAEPQPEFVEAPEDPDEETVELDDTLLENQVEEDFLVEGVEDAIAADAKEEAAEADADEEGPEELLFEEEPDDQAETKDAVKQEESSDEELDIEELGELDVSDALDLDEEEEEEYIPRYKKRQEEENISPEDMKKEARRFWIFTAVIAVLVAAAVLFILYKREIIFAPAETTPVAVSTTQPTTPVQTTTELQTTTEAPTTSETPTTTEPTTEPPTETSEADLVVANYSNPFVVVDTDTLNIRATAEPAGQVVGYLARYAGGEVVGESGDWYEVQSGAVHGFVSKQFAKTGDDAIVLMKEHYVQGLRVTADSLNVRGGASTEAAIVGSVVKGAVFENLGLEGDFYKIQYNATTVGYVNKDFVTAGVYMLEANIN